MSEQELITLKAKELTAQELQRHLIQEKETKRNNYRQQNTYIQTGRTLFTGSSLMEQFPIAEFCASAGLPVVYNRGIGGYNTDEFLAAIDDVLLNVRPSKVFINIGTNDICARSDGEDWFDHLSVNERKICEIIRDRLSDSEVYLMAYYPVNGNVPAAKANPGMLVRTNRNINRANEMLQQLASEFGFHYIDVNDGLKDSAGNLQEEHTRDGVHFDAVAYRAVFEKLRQYL